jgi:putative tryptophan/tyrosine transport system substrate-binding protein
MLSRRSMLIALPAAFGCQGLLGNLRGAAAGGARRVAVLFPSALEPCVEAVEGLRLRLSGNEVSLDLADLNSTTFTTDADRAMAGKPVAVVAIGSEALHSVLDREPQVKIISTMTLEADRAAGSRAGRVAAAVYLDIPIRTVIAELRKLFPEKARVGLIRNPGRGGETSQIRSQAPDLEIADCATADELLPVFLAFRKRVDFVICLPDGSLYNSATARPLIMASLENRLPIVGFSPAFLRAGAALAVYPDYRGIGQQTADLVRRCLEPGDFASRETPRKINVAVNAKVLRMLGLDFKAGANPDLVIVR